MFRLNKEMGIENDHKDQGMSPQSLNDDMVKLVSYSIVSIKRDAERLMPGGSDSILVTDSMSGETFTSWMIARYLQSDDYKKLLEDSKKKIVKEKERFLEEDEKYLRIDYVVRRRWPRQPLQFEERQVEVLRQIRDVYQ
jgi:hypothetical protein